MEKENNSTQDDIRSYWEFKVARDINLYLPPIIITIGFIGNLLSFLVYIKKKYRNKVAPIYILSLAVIDTINLFLGLFQYWLLFNFFQDTITSYQCHVMFFIVNTVANHAHWLVVAFTIDRFLAVWFPFWTKTHQTTRQGWLVVFGIGILAILKNLHYIWTADFIYHKDTNIAQCGFGLVNKHSWISHYQIFELFISSLFPFAVIIILNTAIIYKMRQSGQFHLFRRGAQVDASQSSSDSLQDRKETSKTNNVSTSINDEKKVCRTDKGKYSTSIDDVQKQTPISAKEILTSTGDDVILPTNTSNNNKNAPRKKRMFDYSLTISLLLVSTVFVFLISPLMILRLYHANKPRPLPLKSEALYEMQYQLFHKLWYMNNAVNFFLYSLSGKTFRKDLKELFSDCISFRLRDKKTTSMFSAYSLQPSPNFNNNKLKVVAVPTDIYSMSKDAKTPDESSPNLVTTSEKPVRSKYGSVEPA